MYKLRTFQSLINVTSKQCFNRGEFKIIRYFNKRFEQRSFRPPTDDYYQHSALSDAFQTNKIKTIEDWIFIKKELTDKVRQITVTNFDAITLSYCLKTKDYDLAELCLRFIQEQNNNLSLGVLGKVFLIYLGMYENNVFKGDYDDTIFKMYDKIRSKYKVLDSVTLEAVIPAVACTKYWKMCLDLLTEIKISSIPNTMSYNYLAAAAFRNKEYSLGWQLIDEITNNNRSTNNISHKAILLDCIENQSKPNLEKLFDFFNNFDIICSVEIARLIEEASVKVKYKPKSATLSEIGKCSNCEKYLPRVTLSEQEFRDLKNAFFDEVIIGKNVFCKTTPEEVDRFKKFLNTGKKYQVVIDGLNVAYATGSENHIVMANNLSSVVDHFAARGKQVLVLGRMHMLKWPRNTMNHIKQIADVFLTQNLSSDDPYLLYCALHSGPNTILISKDYMRSHTFLLKNVQHKRLFKRWLGQCRHEFVRIQQNGQVVFTIPLPYLPICQEIPSGWHVPYLLNGENFVTNMKINNWLCIQK